MKISIVYKLAISSALLVLLGVAVVGGLLYSKSTELLITNAIDEISREVENSGGTLKRIVIKQNEDVLFVASLTSTRNLFQEKLKSVDRHQSKKNLESVISALLERKKNYLSVRVMDKEGKELVHVGRNHLDIVIAGDKQLQNKSHRVYFKEAARLKIGDVYVSEINLNREYGKVIVPHEKVLRSATPIYNEITGVFEGVIAVTAEVGEQLHAMQKHVSNTSDNEIYITNDQGDYLLHPDKSKTYGFDLDASYRIQKSIPLLAKLFNLDNRDHKMTLMPEDMDGKRVVSFNKILFDPTNPDRFIAVIISQDYATIAASQSGVLNDVLILAAVLTLLATGLGVLFSVRLTRPLTDIVQVMNDYAAGRKSTSTLPVYQNDEIGLLAKSFSLMIKNVDDAQADYIEINSDLEKKVSDRTRQLELSEKYQRAVLENMVDGLITIDDKGTVNSFNPAAVKIFGYLPDEVIGNNIKMLMPEPYHSEHDGYLENHHQTHKKNIIGIDRDIEGKRKDGSVFPMELAMSEMTVNGEKLYTELVRDVTERKQIEKMKNEFISTVSHELRTPLTSIRGSLGLLAGGAVGDLPEAATDMLKIASNNTERLLVLINDILDIQKIESGVVAFNFQVMDVMSFLEQTLQDNEGYSISQRVKFTITSSLPDSRLFADKDRMMQVMANLLSNAAKFSPENETVEISVARHHDDTIRISVTDHGVGIPVEFQPKLFDKFTQSDASDTRKKGGTGLGLSITKVIVEKHGGRIDFVSGEGIGTTFYIELPELVGQGLQSDGEVFRKLPLEGHLPCILIVEDDPDIAALIQRMLAEDGYNSDIAYDANDARLLLRAKPGQYRAITLDLILPGENGISLLESLRREADTHDIPVVVVSVRADETKRELSGGAMGVVDWLTKPIDQQRLIDAVNQAAESGHVPRVLHVEDEVDVHKVVSAILKDSCDLTWVSTVAAARESLESTDYDLVLLDINLPDGSGLDLIDVIEHKMNVPKVVIFSAYDVSEEYAEKVSAVLMKSKTDNDKLTEIITSIISGTNRNY